MHHAKAYMHMGDEETPMACTRHLFCGLKARRENDIRFLSIYFQLSPLIYLLPNAIGRLQNNGWMMPSRRQSSQYSTPCCALKIIKCRVHAGHFMPCRSLCMHAASFFSSNSERFQSRSKGTWQRRKKDFPRERGK